MTNQPAVMALLNSGSSRSGLRPMACPTLVTPLTIEALQRAIGNQGELPHADMLFGLQLRSREGTADWQALEPALDRLAELVAPEDPREVIDVAGDTWWLEIGPVDLDQQIVTIQRKDLLVAAIRPREDGRLRIATYRPLDAKSAEYLLGLSLNPHPEHGVCMRDNNWEYALDCSAGTGNWYAFDRGEAHLSWWEHGIGISQDGDNQPHWRKMRNLIARRPAKVAIELGVRYSLREED